MSDGSIRRPRRPGLALAMRALVGIGILAAGVAIAVALVATRPEPPRVELRERPLAVRTLTVRPVPVRRVWNGHGTARAVETAQVAAEIAGVVIERAPDAEAGRWIRQGEPITAIDPREYEAQVAAAEAAIEAFRAQLAGIDIESETLGRSLTLAEEAVEITRNELEQLEQAVAGRGAAQIEVERLRRDLTLAERDAATLQQQVELLPTRRAHLQAQIGAQEAQLRAAQINLERTRIIAPITGVLQEVVPREGDRVAPGAPIARIVDLRRIEIPLSIPVSAAGLVVQGSPATVMARSIGGTATRTWEGEVVRVAPEADPATRTFTVFVEVVQPLQPGDAIAGATLVPGEFVTARVFEPAPSPRIVIPRVAVNADRALVIADSAGDVGPEGRVVLQPVRVAFYLDERFPELDPRVTQWAVIEEGLEPGARVITSNLDDLRAGALVVPADAAPPPPAPATQGGM